MSWLNPAVGTGRVRVIARAFAYRIDTARNGQRATGVRYIDARGRRRKISGDVIVAAGSPINTARLLLMSASAAHPEGLGNGSDQLGRNMMFHNFTLAAAVFSEDIHPNRAQSNPLQLDDLIGPFTDPDVQSGAAVREGRAGAGGRRAAADAGGGHLRGVHRLRDEHKQLMKAGLLHSRVAGSQLVGEDLPQAENRIDLDPEVKDYRGFPAARITYSPHKHEQVAAQVLGARLEAMHAQAPGAIGAAIIPIR